MQKQDQEQSSHFLPDYKREHWRKLDKPITISDFINREIPTNWQEWPIGKGTHTYSQQPRQIGVTGLQRLKFGASCTTVKGKISGKPTHGTSIHFLQNCRI